MDLFFAVRDTFARAFERKKLLIFLAAAFAVCAVLGAVFVKTPAGYGYHVRLCKRYLEEVCFSERSVFLIFLERTAGHALFLALILSGGMHLAALFLPVAALFYRACTFGGSLVVFFSVYRMTGALAALVLYIPVHLLFDALFLFAASLSFSRARRFCREEFFLLLRDFLCMLLTAAILCLAEAVLLAAFFHPLGNVT